MTYPANLPFEILIIFLQISELFVCLAHNFHSDSALVMARHVLQHIRNPLVGCGFAKKWPILFNLAAIHALSWLGLVYESFPVNKMRDYVVRNVVYIFIN